MRAVFWKEFRELIPVGLALVLVCVAVMSEMVLGPIPGLRVTTTVAIGLGTGVGLMQAFLDRARRRDEFFLHRPISPVRIHVVRSLAGFCVCLGVFSSLPLGHALSWRRWEALDIPSRFDTCVVTVKDIDIAPVTASEHGFAAFCGLMTLPRPLLLNAAAFQSEPPGDWQDLHRWWWRDPFYAGYSYPAWLAASFGVALLCAWFVRRSARIRCASMSAVRAWTVAVFLLGPLGLLWFRLVVCAHAVQPVGDARRAVNLDRCPATDAPWPEPRPDGTEVLA